MRAAALSLDAYGTIFEGGSDAFIALVREEAARSGLDAAALLARREELVRRVDAAATPRLRDRDRWILGELFGPREDVDALLDRLDREYRNVTVYDDARRLLDALGGRMRWGVVSNADAAVMEALLAEHGLGPDFVVTSEAAGAYKPDARIFRRAAEAAGVPPGALLHAGDSWVADVEGAKGAGLLAAWVDRGGLPRPASSPVEADLVIRDLTELLPSSGGSS